MTLDTVYCLLGEVVLLDSLCSDIGILILLKSNCSIIIIVFFIHLLLNTSMVLLCCCLAKSHSKYPLLHLYGAGIIILMQCSSEVIFCLERQNLMFETNAEEDITLFSIISPCEASQIRHFETISHSVPDY